MWGTDHGGVLIVWCCTCVWIHTSQVASEISRNFTDYWTMKLIVVAAKVLGTYCNCLHCMYTLVL